MPLIRAIRDFVNRRMEVPDLDSRADVYHDLGAGYGVNMGGLVWFVLLLVALPVIAFLVTVGVIYEGVVRVDRGQRVPAVVHWLASLAVVIIGLAFFFVVVLPRFMT